MGFHFFGPRRHQQLFRHLRRYGRVCFRLMGLRPDRRGFLRVADWIRPGHRRTVHV